MGDTDTLSRAGSALSDEDLLRGEPPPNTPESSTAEQEIESPESPQPEVPEQELGEPGPGEEEAEPEKAAEAVDEGEAESDVEEPFSEREVPENIKALFKQEGVGPQIRDLYYRDLAYRDVFSTVQEAREVREILPDGVETAKELLDVVQRVEPFEEAFEKAQASGEGATEFWNQVYNTDQQAYHHLHTSAAENVLHYYADQAKKSGDENLTAAVDVLWRRINGQEYRGRAAQEQTSLRESSLDEREQALNDRELSRFKEGAFAQTDTEVTQAITAHVNTVLKDSKIPARAMGRIIEDINQEIQKRVGENPTLRIQLNRAYRTGDHGPEHQKSIVSIVVNRAKGMLPEVARSVIKDWTEVLLTQNQVLKQRQQTSHADVGTGGPPGQPNTHLPKPGQVDYGQVSDVDLLTAPEIPLKQR
jgi:hypothetical protein